MVSMNEAIPSRGAKFFRIDHIDRAVCYPIVDALINGMPGGCECSLELEESPSHADDRQSARPCCNGQCGVVRRHRQTLARPFLPQ